MQNNLFHNDDDENRVEIIDLDTLNEESVDTALFARKVPRKRRDQRRIVLAIRTGLAVLTLAASLTLGILIWPTVAPNFSAFNKPTPSAPILTPRPHFNITSQVFSSNGIAYIFATSNGIANTENDPHNLANTSLEAVRQSDGTVLWNFREWNNNVAQAPDQVFLATGTLYISALNGLEALRASDGQVLWQKATVGHVILINNTAIYTDLPQGSGIVALRASDGQILWQNSTVTYALPQHPEDTASQALYVFDNGKSSLLSLNPIDGSISWRYHIPIGSSMLTSTNSEINSFSNPTGSLFASASKADATGWHHENILKIWTTYDARLYALLSNGHVVALDPLTGSILWDQSSIGDILQLDAGVLYTTPLAANGIDARNSSNGNMLWHANIATFPIIAQDGVLYISTPTALTAFNATNGQRRWQVAAVKVQILQIADGNLYLQLADEGLVEILKVQNGQKLWTYNGYDSTENSLSEQYGITYISSLSSGSVVARRSSDGKVLWTHPADLINNRNPRKLRIP